MKAVVYKGNRRFSVEDLPMPVPGPGQVLIKVKYSAICGTDVHAYLYEAAAVGSVMGHEYSGTIARVGPNVTLWKEGDRVMGGGGAPPAGTELTPALNRPCKGMRVCVRGGGVRRRR